MNVILRALASGLVVVNLAGCPGAEGEGEEGEGEGEEGEGEGEGEACTNLDPGPAVEIVNVAAAMPAPGGGVPIIDGTWGLVGVEVFDVALAPGPTGDFFAAKLRTTENDTLEIAQSPGESGGAVFNFVLDDTAVAFTGVCPPTAELPATGWSSDGIQLELFLPTLNQVLSFEQQ